MEQSQVYLSLAERLNFPQSRYLPRVFEKLFTPKEGEILLALPASSQAIAQKFNMDEAAASKKLEELIVKGLVIPRTREGETEYSFVRTLLQFHDCSGIYEAAGAEYLDLWRQWRETEGWELCREWERMPVPIMRVFPYRESIKEDSGVLPNEDLHAIVNSARAIAVVKCVCRLIMKKCNNPLETCLTFDAAADFALRRGLGRKLSVEETLQIIQRCAKEGLVPSNANRPRVAAMCFCCKDCCVFMDGILRYGYGLFAPSRYQALVAAELCNGCEACIELCPFNALEMQPDPTSREPKAVVHTEKCYGCGVCGLNCPLEAIDLKLVRPPEYIQEASVRVY